MKIAVLDLSKHPEPLMSDLPRASSCIVNWLSHSFEEADFKVYDLAEFNDAVPKLSTFDGLILSGSELGVYNFALWMPSVRNLLLETKQAGKPIFGICLGLQAIVEVFGGSISNMDQVFHGVATSMKVTKPEAVIFHGIEEKFQAARYHSCIASNDDFPNELEITSEDEEGGIMAIRHRDFPISAVQFHPESILTEVGEQLVKNFIDANKI